MPQYMSTHRAPGLLPQNWDESSVALYASRDVRFVQAYVNLGSGFIVTIYEAPSSDAMVEAFEEWGFPYEEMHEVQFSQSFAQMEQRLKDLGKI